MNRSCSGYNPDAWIERVFLLESANVGNDLVGKIPLCFALLHIGAIQALDVALIEDRWPRTDSFQFGANLLEKRRLEHARSPCGGVTIFFKDVPAAEHDIIQRRKGHDFTDPVSYTHLTLPTIYSV